MSIFLQYRSRSFFDLLPMSHSFTVSNNQVYSKDEFDLWPVYSAGRFRAPWPSLGGRKEQFLKKKNSRKGSKNTCVNFEPLILLAPIQ